MNGQVVASGHLEPTDTCYYLENEGKDSNYAHRFTLDTDSVGHEEAELKIFERLMERAAEISRSYPDKRIQVGCHCDYQDLEQINYLLSKGFHHAWNYFILKRDLTQPLPTFAPIEGIEIKRWAMETHSEREQYLQAEKVSSDGETWSMARLVWYMHGPEWDTFTAFHGDQPISSCMTWGISEERSATEQIFTHPDYRKQGIAKRTIVEAMKFLRDEKKRTEATLGVVGNNQPAINLYKSLGYELIDVHLLMVKDI
ncbi:GNAT family N-acetyltransferase [Paenibacillus sp. N1-5-1-14]|uniref:GNAT family N-acetyltransferase n=1 Tax=Paenibacillus radicibacter TaxID=2972488 RepID=UPI0021593864|nr:GNAT family N-acetyltransferase [Paenibacillus radicibacter]MCR8643432.1 GNAT family N-acetyltransferase [Paenibacillus radicibacter]